VFARVAGETLRLLGVAPEVLPETPDVAVAALGGAE
jgi:hypothetical protein